MSGFLDLLDIENKFLKYILYNFSLSQISFEYIEGEFNENKQFYDQKSFSVQMNIFMISLFNIQYSLVNRAQYYKCRWLCNPFLEKRIF